MDVPTSLCPSSSCTVRISYPSSSRWVAKLWRKVGGVTCLSILVSRAARFTDFCSVLGFARKSDATATNYPAQRTLPALRHTAGGAQIQSDLRHRGSFSAFSLRYCRARLKTQVVCVAFHSGGEALPATCKIGSELLQSS